MRPADNRSKFLEAFHNLLHQSSVFFKEDYRHTVIADGFPLLNALKEVHLILAQGAHNQFGELPWTARAEMLLPQWMLARPEMREFLQSRVMVPYKEPWMPQVDTMKTMQGWTDVTVTHFRDLAVYGEQILLSVRYGDWIDVNDEDSAKNWARYWRPEIQGYLHAYRAATGVELTNPDNVDATIPAVLLQRRLAISSKGTVERQKRCGNERRRCWILRRPYIWDLSIPHDVPAWPRLTLGKPAALEAPAHAPRRSGNLRRSTGCERALVAPSTLHLFWDLFAILAHAVSIFLDEGAYPIARWGVERAAASGTGVRSFWQYDPVALQEAIESADGKPPVIVADGYCPDVGTRAPITE